MIHASTPTQALLLHCPHCGQSFAEMMSLIGHRCVTTPGTPPPKRRPRPRRHEAHGGGEGQPWEPTI